MQGIVATFGHFSTVADLLEAVEVNDAGHCFWNRGDPQLNTALGVLALLTTGNHDEVTAAAVEYLVAEQDSERGSWPAGVFFRGRLAGGVEASWVCAAQTTAMAMEALCRHELAVADR